MNKRGEVQFWVVALAIALLVLWVSSSFAGRTGSSVFRTVSKIEFQSSMGLCEGRSASLKNSPQWIDVDGDGNYDGCDVCILDPESRNGPAGSVQDSDFDLVPDACESDQTKNDQSKIQCAYAVVNIEKREFHCCSFSGTRCMNPPDGPPCITCGPT
ncbi:hypothetical protein JXB02_03910 [Candidatus Woesearchaeota archaeon]|nr:hypothetical protein [Candidatus Woesearchaeota archaeon]